MIKIGRIPFLNLLPIFYYLEKYCSERYSFLSGVPSEVNDYLRKGVLDISPSSSIEYLRDPESYRIIPGHSISSTGPVKSIYLFTKKPLKEIAGEVVLHTYKSETATALLKIICERFYCMGCKYKESRLPLKEGLDITSGYLLIGDEAMIEFKNNQLYHVYDLGEIWYKETGLPFVFALWITRKDLTDETIMHLREDLNGAKSWASEHYEEIAKASRLSDILGENYIVQYWRSLSYELDDKHMKGLELFKRYLLESGLIG
ncbi:MAG: menaquinone biosynthesis protein [Nitrospirae bacterium]|nr:menaquinone biosynthesis protein [Nitrospirota bacterium]